MIEVNTQAKPYNPAEEIVGAELFWKFHRCQLVGSHYYCDKPPADSGKDVLALIRGQYGLILDLLHDGGWEEVDFPVGGIVHAFKKDINKVLLTTATTSYQDFLMAQEVCKYMGLTLPQDKQHAINLHKIICEGMLVEIKGDEVKLVGPKPAIHNPLADGVLGGVMADWGGQFGAAAAQIMPQPGDMHDGILVENGPPPFPEED
jgi:hypothetical protein